MTPRDVIDRLTLEQRAEIAMICMERLDVNVIFDLLSATLGENEMLEIGLRIRHGLPATVE